VIASARTFRTTIEAPDCCLQAIPGTRFLTSTNTCFGLLEAALRSGLSLILYPPFSESSKPMFGGVGDTMAVLSLSVTCTVRSAIVELLKLHLQSSEFLSRQCSRVS
jgi:hypothetical protein